MPRANPPHRHFSQDLNNLEDDEELALVPQVETPAQVRHVRLLPCPCCGGDPSVKDTDIFCLTCGMRTGVRFRLEISIGVWNTRVKKGKNV